MTGGLLGLAIVVALWASVGGQAMEHDPPDALAPLRRAGLVARVATVSLVLAPLAAAAIGRLLGAARAAPA